MADRPSSSGDPGDSINRPARIDLLRTLKTGDLVPVNPNPPSKFLQEMRKNLLPVDQAKEEIRSNKRDAPFKFIDAYKSLKQVCDNLYAVKSEYEDFCNSQKFLDRLTIAFLPNKQKQAKWQKLLEKIEELSSNPNFSEGSASTFAKNQMKEMNESINSMNDAKNALGLSSLSKENKKTMEKYRDAINSRISIFDTNLIELQEKFEQGLNKIKEVEEARKKTKQLIIDLLPRLEQILEYRIWSQKGYSSKRGAIVDSKSEELKEYIRQLTLDGHDIKRLTDETNQDLERNTIIIGTLLKNSEKLAADYEKLSQGLKDIEEQLDKGTLSYLDKIEGQKSEILKDLTALPVPPKDLNDFVNKLADEADTLLNRIRIGKSVPATDPLASLQQRTNQFDSLATISKQFENAKKLINEYRRARLQLKEEVKQYNELQLNSSTLRATVDKTQEYLDKHKEDLEELESLQRGVGEQLIKHFKATTKNAQELLARTDQYTPPQPPEMSQELADHSARLARRSNALEDMHKKIEKTLKEEKKQSYQEIGAICCKVIRMIQPVYQNDFKRVLENLHNSQNMLFFANVLKKEFGSEAFQEFSQHLQKLYQRYVEDPINSDMSLLDLRAELETLSRMSETLDHTHKTLDKEARSMPYMTKELYTYLENYQTEHKFFKIEVYKHFTDTGKEIKARPWRQLIREIMPRTYEYNRLKEVFPQEEMQGKVKIREYAEEPMNHLCNCFSFVFTDRKGGCLEPEDVENILADHKYEKVQLDGTSQILPSDDDIILYRRRATGSQAKGEIVHCGYFEGGKVISKWGQYGVYEHEISVVSLVKEDPHDQFYYEIYHTDRGSRLLLRDAEPTRIEWVRVAKAAEAA
jgi:DNA repair exonuclease SbcCD ATPase subunit